MKGVKFNTFASVTKMPYGKTKEEHRAYFRWWRNKDVKDYNKKRLEWSKSHPERRKLQARRSYLSKKFGISMEQYDKMLKEQNNKCKICGKIFEKMNSKKEYIRYDNCIDHCHKTGNVRGMLCLNCNLGLGNFMDNTKALKNAIKYLKGYYDDKAINPKDMFQVKEKEE